MIAGLYVFVGNEFVKLLDYLERHPGHVPVQQEGRTSVEIAKWVRRMSSSVEKYGWDGEWFLRAYDAQSEKVGSKECEEGKIFIEPQGFCVMAGIGKEEGIAEKALDSVNELLELTPPGVAQESFIARRFALLALIEKGRLNKEMFLYGVTSAEDFIFKDHDEPLCRHFNSLFFRSMNMPNEVIRQSFQQQIQSTFGTNFNVLRRLAVTNLEMKNYPLAKKYLDILSHSTVMKSWAEERRPQLEAIKNVKPDFEQRLDQFYSADLLVAMGAMADRYPTERKYADVLLCALLANKDGNQFYPAFKVIAERQYAHGEPIPAYYEQALMLVAPSEPEVMQLYKISQQTQDAFQNVMKLLNNGQKSQLPNLLPNSFWAYFF